MSKLVRDNIPTIIMEEGRSVKLRSVSGEELKRALIAKLEEEIAEYHEVLGKDELATVMELIDIVTVANKLLDVSDKSWQSKRVQKDDRNGRFDKGYILEDE